MRYKGSLLITNISAMVSLRGLEYICSFLLVPYLLRVLGPERFGAVAFMQSIIGYILLIVDYGFNLTAPRAIVSREKAELGELFSLFMSCKFILLIIGTLGFFGIYLISAFYFQFHLDIKLFLAVYLSVVGNVLFPIWFFQGIQELKYITLFNTYGRLFSMAGIFIFVHSPSDYVLAAGLQACVPMVAGTASLYMLWRRFPRLWVCPTLNQILKAFIEGWRIFISMLAVNIYTTTNIVILGIFTNNTIVGYYSGAMKLIECVRRLIDAFGQALYPYITKTIHKNFEEGILFLKRLLYIVIGCSVVGTMVLFFGAESLVHILLGTQYKMSVILFEILSILPGMVAISYVFGMLTMLPLNLNKEYSNALLAAACFSFICVVPLTYFWGAVGTAITATLTECLIVGVMGSMLKHKRILI